MGYEPPYTAPATKRATSTSYSPWLTPGMSAIHTEKLSKRYGATLVLDSLDLTVNEGEVYGYLGPNGAGKTTTIRLLLGLHRPSGGRAELFGVDAWGDPVTAHRRVAHVAGEPFLWPSLTGTETFELPRASAGIAYGLVLVGFLWQLFGSLLGAPKWLVDLTPFAHVGLVPAQPFRPGAAAVMVGIGVAAGLVALAVFRRRDLLGA
jgi:hypothetical protein